MARSTTTTRVAVRDLPASVVFTASTQSINNTTAVTGFDSASTISLWYKTGNNVTTIQRIARIAIATGVSEKVLGISLQSGILRGGYYNGSSYVSSTSGRVVPNTWYHLAVTWDGSASAFYVNGVLATTTGNNPSLSQTIGATVGATTSATLGSSECSSFKVWTRALSASEISTLYYSNVYDATSMWLNWKLTEGAGSLAYDSSGNGNDGTITGATYTADTPSKARKQVGGNLITNGDFSYVPVVNVETNTNAKWIDGTAGGTNTKTIFGWSLSSLTGTGTAGFDTTNTYNGKATLKVSTSAVSSRVIGSIVRSAGTASLVIEGAVRVLPSTSYTLTGWMKTNYTSGDSSNGAYFRLGEYTGGGATITSTDSSYIKTTTDWTKYTVTVTTSATTRFLAPELQNQGNSGTATLIMDAWFADITLTPTVNTTRSAASGRTAV